VPLASWLETIPSFIGISGEVKEEKEKAAKNLELEPRLVGTEGLFLFQAMVASPLPYYYSTI
jgi:hypothetical protein